MAFTLVLDSVLVTLRIRNYCEWPNHRFEDSKIREMRILIPTDFSNASETATKFCISFSKTIKADIILLHVLPEIGPTLGTHSTAELLKEMLAETQDTMLKTINRFITENVSLFSQIVHGSSVHKVLPAIVESEGIDMIVIGNVGASRLKQVLFGSNTIDVINHANVPVIAVPEHLTTERLTHLLYASDFLNLRSEIKRLVPLARALNVSIKILNLPPAYYMEYINTERLIEDLKRECDFDRFEICLVQGSDITSAIEAYAASSEGELVTMFTHHMTFLEQIFRKSLTRELVWHNKIPLLVIAD